MGVNYHRSFVTTVHVRGMQPMDMQFYGLSHSEVSEVDCMEMVSAALRARGIHAADDDVSNSSPRADMVKARTIKVQGRLPA